MKTLAKSFFVFVMAWSAFWLGGNVEKKILAHRVQEARENERSALAFLKEATQWNQEATQACQRAGEFYAKALAVVTNLPPTGGQWDKLMARLPAMGLSNVVLYMERSGLGLAVLIEDGTNISIYPAQMNFHTDKQPQANGLFYKEAL